MFIVIVLGVLLIIGIAYVYKKVKALRASTAYEKAEEVFNKVKEAKKALEKAKEAEREAEKVMEATPAYKAYKEARKVMEATPEYKNYKEALCAGHKMYVAYLEADFAWKRVRYDVREEMEEEAW